MTLAVSIAQSGANNVTMRNRVINGNMMIDQRNAGASVAVATNSVYGVDRWQGQVLGSGTGRFSIQRSSTVPTQGFAYSNVVTVTTADAAPASNYGYVFEQVIEGNNLADLNWGSSSAQSITLSFWVRSSVTGTFGAILENYAGTLAYCATYTINSANTWEYKTLTVAGPTSGSFPVDNSGCLHVAFGLGGGSTRSPSSNNSWVNPSGFLLSQASGGANLMATNGATFYITGVQLEKGTTATAFEQRLYGTELALCQRYYQAASGLTIRGAGTYSSSGAVGSLPTAPIYLQATMRAAPTVTVVTDATGGYVWGSSSTVGFTIEWPGSSGLNSKITSYTASSEL